MNIPDLEPGIPIDDRGRPLPLKNDERLRCPRCRRDLTGKPTEIHQGRRIVRCKCGYLVRVIRTPRPVEPRGRERMSKKERRRRRTVVRGTWKPQGGEV